MNRTAYQTVINPLTQLFMRDPYQEKAASKPIDGPNKELALEVRRLLGWTDDADRPFLSTRAAEFKTEISNGTIATMARGGRVHPDTLRKFAEKMNADPLRLQVLGGYIDPRRLAQPVAEDPLSRVGPDVDLSAISGIRLSPFLASAGDGFQPPDPGTFEETFESVLPGQVRAIRVQGDCMAPLYQDGDVVFVREQGNAENGNKVVAMVDDDKLFCKVYRTNGEAYLEPKNGEGKVPASRFRIIGVIVGVFRKED